MTQVTDLQDQITALEAVVGSTSDVVSAFDTELARMRETMLFTSREVATLSTGIGSGLRRAFDGLVFDGLRLNDALKMVAKTMIDQVYNVSMRPVQNAVGGLVANGINGLLSGLLPFEKGAAFQNGRVTAFAKGGVVGAPMTFPMRGGTGLMGEAGPEAILPLSRGANGALGVQMQGGGRPVTVIMNIQTPDAQSFQRSQSQIAAQAARLLSQGQKNR